MRMTATLVLTLTLAALTGCAGAERSAGLVSSSNSSAQDQTASSSQDHGAATSPATAPGQAVVQNVSLQQADASQNAPAAVERKIIRNASLSLEAEEPAKATQRVATVAETRGGFVVTSESRQQSGAKGGRSYEVFTLEIRVPAAQFDAALGDIRAAGSSVTSEKISGKDVTEEYIDLEARLRTQRALEAQLLEIMKSAHAVSDAISVERELTNVRTEIERVEGRRRFLENQASLSTINVTIQPPAPLVNTTGFFHSVGSAFGEGIDLAATITLFLIRVALALLPVALFIGLPIFLLLRFIVRRARRRALAPAQQIQPRPAEGAPEPRA
ncbi:MAG: hypothetical protein QOC99_2248 [Acidobacteriota bacterium]|nr:hypothetical protein [Acidobacteriota bacterium]MDT7779736.1 hypothetical protein [Acidobacteriota bacterium]